MAMSRISSTRRNAAIALSVVVFHVAALWALQNGLLRRAVEVFIPAEIISEFVEPAATQTVKPVPAPAPRPPAKMTPPPETRVATPEPAVIPEPVPAPNAPVVVAAPPPVATQAAPTAPAAVTSHRVELPSSDAQYLQNPKPSYPAISKRLGEQGKVMVRVLIGVDGRAQKAEVAQSSGYERLDQAALNTVLAWRYVPGKRGGVPEAMWFNVPINFILE
jgi:protein TonB